MKKKLIIFISVILVLFSVAVVAFRDEIGMYLFHLSMVDYIHDYTETSVENGKYVFHTKILEDENSRVVTFYITENGKTVFEADESWRIRELKYIGFKDGSYDVLVESGDVGTTEYIYNGETWELR